MKTLTNTTVISNFAAVNRLDLLRSLLGRLYISTEVYEEILNGLEEGYIFYEGIDELIFPFADDGWIELVSLAGEEELRRFGQIPKRLHRGKASCLAIARERKWAFLTDDKLARRMARKWNIEVSGTLGILVRAMEMSLLAVEEANVLLRQMTEHANYHSPIADLRVLLTD